jgi:excisionase family DNA binding protein
MREYTRKVASLSGGMTKAHTTSEAAKILDLQPKTVTGYIERGLIAAQKHGRDYLIESEELERFKRERRGRGKPATKNR